MRQLQSDSPLAYFPLRLSQKFDRHLKLELTNREAPREASHPRGVNDATPYTKQDKVHSPVTKTISNSSIPYEDRALSTQLGR